MTDTEAPNRHLYDLAKWSCSVVIQVWRNINIKNKYEEKWFY